LFDLPKWSESRDLPHRNKEFLNTMGGELTFTASSAKVCAADRSRHLNSRMTGSARGTDPSAGGQLFHR
jgi:hypothetical protein